MLALIGIALAMGVTDVLATALVIAQARGRAWLAGTLDALSDVSRLVYLALGVSALDQINRQSLITLIVVCVTSFVATTATTRIASRTIS